MNRYKFISLAQPDANAILMIGNRILIENSDAFAYNRANASAPTPKLMRANGKTFDDCRILQREKKQQMLLTYTHLRRVELQAN